MLLVGGWPGCSHKSWRGLISLAERKSKSPPSRNERGKDGAPARERWALRTKVSDKNVPSAPLRAGSFGCAQGRPTHTVSLPESLPRFGELRFGRRAEEQKRARSHRDRLRRRRSIRRAW